MKKSTKKSLVKVLVFMFALTQLCFSAIETTASTKSSAKSSEESSITNSKGKTVYFKLPKEWTGRIDGTTGKTLNPAAYISGGNDGPVSLWVGVHMNKVDGTEDIYSYTIPGDQNLIIFNTGKEKDWQTGELAITGGDMIFIVDKNIETKNAIGHWEPYNNTNPAVAISSGTFSFVGEKTLTLSRFNSTSGTYKINDNEEIPFNDGDEITFGKDIAENTNVKLTVTATNNTTTYSYEYIFKKVESMNVYVKNNADWQDLYIHYWGGTPGTVWPGEKMSLVEGSEDVYEIKIPANSSNYKFNNGYADGASELLQTSNLDTQDLISGVSECYILKTNEYTTLDKALTNEPIKDMPLIQVNNSEAKLNESFNVDVSSENVSTLMGYIIELSYDANILKAIVPENNIIASPYGDVYANIIKPGSLLLLYSDINELDFADNKNLLSVNFMPLTSSTTQTKIKVNVLEMLSDENTEIKFSSSNLVSGKSTIGVDKSILLTKLNYINSINESDYSAVSYQNLMTTAKNAQLIYDSITATQENVDNQVELLVNAIDALVLSKDGDYFYFKNTVNWDEVYAYWWGSDSNPCPAFPGIKANKLEGTSDIYYIEVPEGATGINFNNKITEGDNKEQTDSITTSIEAGKIFVPNAEDFYEKNGGLRYRGVIEDYIPNKIYFKNVMNWDTVNAYWWGSTINECSPFPGVKAKLLEGTTDIYYIILPEDATGLNFNNGKPTAEGGEQTSSITAFEKGKIFVIDPDSAYEKNGGIRYNGVFDDLDNNLPTDKPDDGPVDKPDDKPTDKPGDDSTDKPSDDSTNKPGDDSTDKPGDDSADKPSDDSSDIPTVDVDGEPNDDSQDNNNDNNNNNNNNNTDKNDENSPLPNTGGVVNSYFYIILGLMLIGISPLCFYNKGKKRR